jgi:hypothetical protein
MMTKSDYTNILIVFSIVCNALEHLVVLIFLTFYNNCTLHGNGKDNLLVEQIFVL